MAICIHGGCWLAQYDIKHSRALANALAREGFAVWNLEYRRVGDNGGGWPGTFLDVAKGADYVKTLAKKHALDLSRAMTVGHSAGGHLALWLAARKKIAPDSDLHMDDPLPIAGVLALAPAPQLEELHRKKVCGHVVDKLMGGSPQEFKQRYREASPSHMAPIGVPQILILGKLDTSWSWVGKEYAKAARAAGDRQIEVVEAPEANHFEVIDPLSSTWPIVRDAIRKLLR